ncbi:efflux RND transporter permease subunit [Butyrivibrio sp. INlla14]|uniref:efflux RND transporter permease subunit n=1 Tax=Butyrivibrio sp. INlla14 TaxID=1520808 RepID=UPI00087729A4|nr:MMPL family transporter [Butyrivibrio sp. INlla14]SCY70656.1 Predicted exporter protein, RND superfamily [Butyrivibrio sp. INlla14]
MDNNEFNGGNSLMLKICAFIVDKRNLFFLIYAILCIFSAISRNWVSVENQLAEYLPESSETWQGLKLMEKEFTTYGSVKVMVANIDIDQAFLIKDDIENIDGVFSCEVDDSEDHYNDGCALFSITFDYDEKEAICLDLLEQVKKYFDRYDYYLSTTLGDTQSELIDKEMSVISIIVVIVVVAVLLLTSQAYAEVPVLLLTFGSAALVQMGTNFLLGTISFVSDSVTIVLQLALSVDYAVIFLNRYKEEHESLPYREACIMALSKSIPEICGSSLTTIGGLVAMLFMQFGIGRDMGIVLIKAILLSLLSVFLLMPGIIMIFAGLMEKTQHKNFIPKIPFVGKFAYATRYIIAPAFIVTIIVASRISAGTPYVYGYSQITPPLINEVQKAQNMQDENFNSDNMVALVFPSGDYDKEKKLIEDLLAQDLVTKVTGLANTEALNGYTLTDKLTPRQFSELLNIDYEIAELVYTAYAVNDEDYAKVVNGLAGYKVPLIDMFMFVYKEVDEGYVTLSDELMDKLENANTMMNFAKKQLQGEEYSRILVFLSLPQESDETFAFLEKMHTMAEKYYDEDKIYVVGESVSQYDLKKCFGRDNKVTGIISILAVLVVLLFTFKSAGMPVLLIAVIQGCIWINFSIPAIEHDNLFFLGYLIVSSIQMGANIDYAIVIAGRYTELRAGMGKKEAIINTMNLSFPTIITSGTMLAVAGTLIGKMTSDCAIYGIGKCLGRGTIISILITMFVLPQILLVGDKIIELTAFVMNMPMQAEARAGSMRIDGLIRGHVDGNLYGTFHGIVKGKINAFIDNNDVKELDESNELSNDATTKEG